MTDLLPPTPTLSPGDEALVREFRQLLALDPSDLTGPELAETVIAADRIRARFDGAVTALTHRWAESLDWAATGSRSPVAWLTAHTRQSRSGASAAIRVGRALRSMPVTAASSEAGALGSAKVALLARCRTPEVAEAFDANETELVETVQGLSVDATRLYLDAWKMRALADGGGDEAMEDHDHDEFHISPTFGGHHAVNGGYCATDGAILTGALDAEIDAWHRQGRLEGDTRTRSQLRAAALISILERGIESTTRNGDVRPLVIGVVDLDVLMGHSPSEPAHEAATDHPSAEGASQGSFESVGSEPGDAVATALGPIGRCELHGVGPVPVETIRRLLCEGDVCRVVLNGDSQPLDVGRRHRVATVDQWRTLLAISGGHCEWPGCDAPADWCQVHHFIPWDAEGLTDIENLGFVCSQHHRAVHEGGHVMTRGPNGIAVIDRHGLQVRPPLLFP